MNKEIRMDEEKRKYLEELKKQIDPEVLSKMANYLGNDGDGAAVSTGLGGSTSYGSVGSGATTAADRIRERRAMQFQERVARRKRENIDQVATKEPAELKEVLIFASNDLWSRIIENQFRNIGFTGMHAYTEFSLLMKHLLEWSAGDDRCKLVVAVAFQDIGAFLHPWEHLRRESEQQPQFSFLHNIHYFIVVEYLKQIQEALVGRLGNDHIICITDEVDINREKVERSLIASNQRSE